LIVIPILIVTFGLFFNNLKLEQKIKKITPLVYEIKEILFQIIKKKNYGTYNINENYEIHEIYTIIKNYISLKNVIFFENSIVIYSHTYHNKNGNYVDEITFIFQKKKLTKIIYKKKLLKRLFGLKNTYLKKPSVKNK
jgi:hypothetical protein